MKRVTDFANGVMDTMVSTGEVRVLYKEFKGHLEAARSVRNEGRGFGRGRRVRR